MNRSSSTVLRSQAEPQSSSTSGRSQALEHPTGPTAPWRGRCSRALPWPLLNCTWSRSSSGAPRSVPCRKRGLEVGKYEVRVHLEKRKKNTQMNDTCFKHINLGIIIKNFANGFIQSYVSKMLRACLHAKNMHSLPRTKSFTLVLHNYTAFHGIFKGTVS